MIATSSSSVRSVIAASEGTGLEGAEAYCVAVGDTLEGGPEGSIVCSTVWSERFGRARGVVTSVGSKGGSGLADGVSGAGSGARPIACSNVGGGDRGLSWPSAVPFDVAAGGSERCVSFVSNAGGRRFVEAVGKGKAGGGSDDSGRSIVSQVAFTQRARTVPDVCPSHTCSPCDAQSSPFLSRTHSQTPR